MSLPGGVEDWPGRSRFERQQNGRTSRVASSLDDRKRSLPPRSGGTDPALYDLLLRMSTAADRGEGFPVMTIEEARSLQAAMGGDLGHVLRRIINRDPATTGIFRMVDPATGLTRTVSVAEFFRGPIKGPHGAGRYYNPYDPVVDKRFSTEDIHGNEIGGYDADEEPLESEKGTPGYNALKLANVSSVGKWPAPITEVPTSTTNPHRPRTVAAGYDAARKVLTVVFRDGTIYNYYGVGGLEWGRFLSTESKGVFIYRFLNNKVRGLADSTSMPPQDQENLYRVARTSQVLARGRDYGKYRTKPPR